MTDSGAGDSSSGADSSSSSGSGSSSGTMMGDASSSSSGSGSSSGAGEGGSDAMPTDSGGDATDGNACAVACTNNPANCPAQTTTCLVNACANNCCTTTNAAQGTVCNDGGGLVCDGSGHCVQCNTSADCLGVNDAGTLSCVDHMCQ